MIIWINCDSIWNIFNMLHVYCRFVIKDKDSFFTNAQRSKIVFEILSRAPYEDDENREDKASKKFGMFLLVFHVDADLWIQIIEMNVRLCLWSKFVLKYKFCIGCFWYKIVQFHFVGIKKLIKNQSYLAAYPLHDVCIYF